MTTWYRCPDCTRTADMPGVVVARCTGVFDVGRWGRSHWPVRMQQLTAEEVLSLADAVGDFEDDLDDDLPRSGHDGPARYVNGRFVSGSDGMGVL